ncbi:Na+/H+ antiporter [Streptomyces sp. RB6PN25]|uniref:Na+/H+ antiporter n=1 Tax=Streptomyces humicola TaxID=2953240 RepID=A0ABT1PRL7_9ACTN|nr:Na+/H+ antiporter [Streptomyces humicola]MCQ4080309.1 Na+/H+ antiporter [Streptomyces humicola]
MTGAGATAGAGAVATGGAALLLLVAGSAAVAGAARRTGISAALLLVTVGLAVSYIPGVPGYRLDPHLVLPFVLPPLLHTEALDSSYLGLRANLRPVALLSVGYVLFATALIGTAAYLLIPGLPLAAALVLGAVVAPSDAVAATAIARRVGLPARMVTILQGESLLNDATAITAYRVALAAAVGTSIGWLHGIGDFLRAAVGGVGVGLVLMVPLHWLRIRLTRLREPLLQNTLSLLIPFVAYAAAERAGASGVLAVVVVGLYLGHHSFQVDFATRLQEAAVWKMVAFILESAVFALIGLQLRVVVKGLGHHSLPQAAGYALVLLTVLILSRFVWTFPATYLPRRLFRRVREADPAPTWTTPFVISWAGMRGVVSLAVAFSIPLTTQSGGQFPSRDLLLFLAFSCVIGTLVLQGFTLPAVVRRLDLPQRDLRRETLIEAQAQSEASQAAEERLERRLTEPGNALPSPLADRLRTVLERRRNAVWERLGGVSEVTGESADATYRRLAQEMIGAEREVFVRLRDERRIDDEMLRTLLRRLDLEEAAAERPEP